MLQKFLLRLQIVEVLAKYTCEWLREAAADEATRYLTHPLDKSFVAPFGPVGVVPSKRKDAPVVLLVVLAMALGPVATLLGASSVPAARILMESSIGGAEFINIAFKDPLCMTDENGPSSGRKPAAIFRQFWKSPNQVEHCTRRQEIGHAAFELVGRDIHHLLSELRHQVRRVLAKVGWSFFLDRGVLPKIKRPPGTRPKRFKGTTQVHVQLPRVDSPSSILSLPLDCRACRLELIAKLVQLSADDIR